MTTEGRVLREMEPGDVEAVLAIQEPASVAGLSGVFPQDAYPFPREAVATRWRAEIEGHDVECFVILRDEIVAGFAAVRGEELLHFGVALEEWGSGLALAAHDELVRRMREAGVERPWLRVYVANPRGRRFWEKAGWRDTGRRSRGEGAPHAELLTYEFVPENVRNPS
jgi:RimJ/RimL family protein N-acetyltransferase